MPAQTFMKPRLVIGDSMSKLPPVDESTLVIDDTYKGLWRKLRSALRPVPVRAQALSSGVFAAVARATVADAATISAANMLGRVLYQNASGGNVTMTTRTGTQIAADFPDLQIGDALQLFVASNHATNTSTIAGGTDVTLVGSGAVTQTGGNFLLIKTAATTFDLVRVG